MRMYFAIIVFIIFYSSNCFSEVLDRVVASIDGSPVNESEIISELKKISATASVEVPVSNDDLKSALTSILLNKEAARLGLTVSQEELDLQLSEIISRSQISKEEFEKTLQANGLTVSQYRDKLSSELNRSRVVSTVLKSRIQVNEEELRQYTGEVKQEDENDVGTFGLLKLIVKTPNFNVSEESIKIKNYLEQGEQCSKYSSEAISSCEFLGIVKLEDLKASYSEVLNSVENYMLTSSINENDGEISFMKINKNYDSKLSSTKLVVRDKLFQDKFKSEAEKYLDKEIFDKYTVEFH